MGMVKHLLEEYCGAVHPDDYDAQDELFDNICNGSVQVPHDEMQAKIRKYRADKIRAISIPTPQPKPGPDFEGPLRPGS